MVEVLRPLLPGVDERFLKSLNAFQTRMGEVQDMVVVTASVNSFTLNSRYAPTLSLVPVQQRLAEIRKQRIDEFIGRADELYNLWATARVAPKVTPTPARRRRGRARTAVKRRHARTVRPAGKRRPAHRSRR